ncbi:6-bladed beta-propeller [Candidatus Palauibacter sp.]|uniref:6-bladed beta-propeller n=1 Tax=Candidatus Palauibacter sp. TaxID=3101350 RepID=UPI003B015607
MLRTAITLVSFVWAASVAGQTTELRLVQELQIGHAGGTGPDVFGDVSDLAVDPHGRIYVLDAVMKAVRLFDRDGRFIREIAPEGQGPGERRYRRDGFLGPASITWDPIRGWLWIDDGRYFQVTDSLGVEHGRDARVSGGFDRNPGPMGKLIAVDSQNRIYEYQREPVGDTSYSYVARGVSAAGSPRTRYLDTLLIDARRMITDDPRTTLRNIGSATVTMVMTSRRPDRDEHIWTVSPEGTVWIAPRQQRQLYELTFAGDTIRAFDIDSEPAELDVSPEGWVWSRRVTDAAESTWDLLDNCGASRGSVSVPYRVSVTEVGSDGELHVVRSDDLDIEYVMRFRLEGTPTRRSCRVRGRRLRISVACGLPLSGHPDAKPQTAV